MSSGALAAWPEPVAFLRAGALLAVAFVLGTAIGFERQWRQRTAGLRTNVLVAVGAAAFAELGFRLKGADGGTQIIAYVVSGIGSMQHRSVRPIFPPYRLSPDRVGTTAFR